MVSAKAVRNQIVPSRAEWRGETDNRATPPVGYWPSTAYFSVRPYCKNARRERCQEYHNCFPFGGLEETTRTSSNYMDEDYPARPEIKQSLTGWGDNCGSESSTLETDVCVWRYTPLVVLATQEEEDVVHGRMLVFNDLFRPALFFCFLLSYTEICEQIKLNEWMNEWKFNIETCAWVSVGDYLKRLCFAETRRIETFCLSAPCTSSLTYLLKTRHSSQLLVFLYSVINKYCRSWRRETVSYCVVIVWVEWVIGVPRRWSRRKTVSLAE